MLIGLGVVDGQFVVGRKQHAVMSCNVCED